MNNISPVNAYTEKNTTISYQSYEIETLRLKGKSSFANLNYSVILAQEKNTSHPIFNMWTLFLIEKRGWMRWLNSHTSDNGDCLYY